MWPRIIEFMLACWLAISPFIFGYPRGLTFLWAINFICSPLIAFFALASIHEPLRKLHLCNLIIAIYFIALSYIFPEYPANALQNYTVLGLLFLMLALIPTIAELPPKPWRDYYKKNSKN